jgi:hypothetical protein
MGAGNIGLLFMIDADPSQANESMHALRKSFKGTFSELPNDIEPVNKALLNQHQTIHLLAEAAGIHLPHAVVSGFSEMLPPINMIGPALLAAFAIAEIPKFIEEVHDAADEMEGFGKAAKKAYDEVIEESDKAYTHAKNLKDAIQFEGEVNSNIGALTRERDFLESTGGVAINYAKAVSAFLEGNGALAISYLDTAKMQQDAQKELDKLGKEQHEQQNTRAEQEKKTQENAHKAAEEKAKDTEFISMALQKWAKEDEEADRRGWQTLAQLDAKRFEIAEKAGRQIDEDTRRLNQQAQAQQFINRSTQEYLQTLDQIYGVEARQAAMARGAGVSQLNSQMEGTKHLSLARKELIGITQDLHQVEDAFSQAMKGDASALESMTQSAGDIAGNFAQMIGGTKAAAGVKGAFDAALSIEYMAQFIGSMGTDVNALLASVQYGLAAAEMFKVAGSGGGSRASGGGGGSQSNYGRQSGGGGGAGGSSGGALPGGGTTIHVHVEGVVGYDSMRQLVAQINDAVKGGQIVLNATHAISGQGRMV